MQLTHLRFFGFRLFSIARRFGRYNNHRHKKYRSGMSCRGNEPRESSDRDNLRGCSLLSYLLETNISWEEKERLH